GGDGTGTGGGGGGSPARLRKGAIRNGDYPRAAVRARAQGTVFVRLGIGANGRVTACEVARSSGSADLDRTTCDLIRRRFRYEPARDAAGRAIPDTRGWRQTWWLEGG
ncbi:MAG TPA: energy transducer TonB, partial [Geminicoccaceae bacterium]